MNRAAYLTATVLIFVASASWSKGQTLRIEIAGDGLREAIIIVDPEILGLFNIWNGPGVTVRGPDGVLYPATHLDPDRSYGRFIDWPRGMATKRPSGLQRLEVTSFVGVPRRPDQERSYVFAYEVDTEESVGFVYLPLWKNDLIGHRVEGNWLYAARRWNEVIAPIVADRTGILRSPSARGDLSCIAGYGSLGQDGVIEFTLADDSGVTSRWRYGPSTEGYENVRAHIGDVKPGEEMTVSCWPPRFTASR